MPATNSRDSQGDPFPHATTPNGRVTPGYFSPAAPPPSADLLGPPEAPPAQQDLSLASPQLKDTGPGTAFKSFFKHYATFSARASRSDYWWVQLFMVALLLGMSFLVTGLDRSGMGMLEAVGGFVGLSYALFLLAIVVPALALSVRRLHDANLSGGFLGLVLVPYVGVLVVFILLLLPSNPQGVRFEKAFQYRP